MKKSCLSWLNAPKKYKIEESQSVRLVRKWVLTNKTSLQEAYQKRINKKPPASLTVEKLIASLVKSIETPPEKETLEQDSMYTVLGGLGLPNFKNEAKQNCEKGHEMEKVYTKQLMNLALNDFPYGKLEQITSVGLIQKKGEPQCKCSIDRILCIREKSTEPDDIVVRRHLLICELKSRLVPTTIQKEKDQIEALKRAGLMTGESIFLTEEVGAEGDKSFLAIKDAAEQLQVLHLAYVSGTTGCVHGVGTSKSLLTVCKMNFPPSLMAAYSRLLGTIFARGLNLFYQDRPRGSVLLLEGENNKLIKKAIEKHKSKVVNMQTFLFTHQLWREATTEENLPLPPCKMIIPLMLL